MPPSLDAVNDALRAECPALFETLSPLGRRVSFPPDIPFQAAEARGKRFNATIGQITDGAGHVVELPAVGASLASLPDEARNRALLYSPVEGIAELRDAWRAWQRRGLPDDDPPSSRPLVTAGLTHGLSLVADLFGGEGRTVAIPHPFWGNYRQAFATRTGARVAPVRVWQRGRFRPRALAEALAPLPQGEPAVALLNFPSNPGGYTPDRVEREELLATLAEVAQRRPLVVVCDDAYAGLVYEPDVPARSLFWDLAGMHRSLVPLKVDGATKELTFFGGRVGFLTFAVAPDSAAAAALESKVKCLSRATLGSPVATSQVILLEALRRDSVEGEVEAVRALLAGRYRALKAALAGVDPRLVSALPFNSGCFALLELPESARLSADEVRRHLLEAEDTGLVSFEERFLRIAFCSVSEEALPELVRRIEGGVRRLMTAHVG